MDRRRETITNALESGDADRVGDAIDEIQAMSVEERRRHFDAMFDDVTAVYDSADDGYVRQSAVRAVERLSPGLSGAVTVVDRDSADEADSPANTDGSTPADPVEQVRSQTDACCGFLLEALTDDDGRVRRSAIRGIRDVFRSYDTLEDQRTIEGVTAHLEELAERYDGSRREHVQEAREDAAFTLQSDLGQVVREFQAVVDRSDGEF